jgi:hypothetical protein
MRQCSFIKYLEIVPGGFDDYKRLSCFHYRSSRLGPFSNVFSLRPKSRRPGFYDDRAVGVIVYTLPSPAVEMRKYATGHFFEGLDRRMRMTVLNKLVRNIGRVIIEPRFRGLGLASLLVRETMGLVGAAIIESMAVMGEVNPFFEKAGMKAYRAAETVRNVRIAEAFSAVGIEEDDLIDAQLLQERIDRLPLNKSRFIDNEIRIFLQAFGKKRNMAGGLERTKFLIGKLTSRPIYYFWQNTKISIEDKLFSEV